MPEDNELFDIGDTESASDALDVQHLLSAQEEKILTATMRAFESGSLTPLVKEELRLTIQTRRLAAGKEELQVEEFKKPNRRKPMTEDEKKRAQTRRTQNREAAQRFRQRQKDQASYLTAKIQRLERASSHLQHDMTRLKTERDELRVMLQEHLLVCTNHTLLHHPTDLQTLLEPTPPSPCSTTTISYCQQPQISFYSSASSSEFLPTDPAYYPDTDSTHYPDTETSNSSVFFSEEVKYVPSDPREGYGDFLHDLVEVQTIDMSPINAGFTQDILEAPELGMELVVGDVSDSLTAFSDSQQRHNSWSSLDSGSCYDSASPEVVSINHDQPGGGLSSSLAVTISMVHLNRFLEQNLGKNRCGAGTSSTHLDDMT